jgi:hypothetical protein
MPDKVSKNLDLKMINDLKEMKWTMNKVKKSMQDMDKKFNNLDKKFKKRETMEKTNINLRNEISISQIKM